MIAPDSHIAQPGSIEELQQAVRNASSVIVSGREDQLRPQLPDGGSSSIVSLSKFNRIVEYQPDEYTVTVESGARVKDVAAALSEHGQYLPFDPPFPVENLTIGSLIARGLSGPGAYRYGILRDFILGVDFIDGLGERIRTGGKVVKNAAGFDVPKLMTGSWGSLGIITQAAFKIFPAAAEYRTRVFRFPDFESGHKVLTRMGRSRFTLDILDLSQAGDLYIKLGGLPESLDQRIAALEKELGVASESADESFWEEAIALSAFPARGTLVKVAASPRKIPALETALAAGGQSRRYSISGYVAWIHWNKPLAELDALLESLGLSAQAVSGPEASTMIGNPNQAAFYKKIKTAFDPDSKFLDLYS